MEIIAETNTFVRVERARARESQMYVMINSLNMNRMHGYVLCRYRNVNTTIRSRGMRKCINMQANEF